MPDGDSEITRLLRRWHDGDEAALEAIVRAHLPWIARVVHSRLGEKLRAKTDTQDIVQEALVAFLRYGPRFLIRDQGQFRALLVRIVENTIRGQHDRFTAQRRSLKREAALPRDSVLCLDPTLQNVERPSEKAARHEVQALVGLAVEVIEPEEREVVLLRQWDDLSFKEIGERLGINEDAARMRFNRALVHLASAVQQIRAGEITEFLTSRNGYVDHEDKG
jgi:RNA polymerase sigma-70 factor (ECF subfamily)